MEKIIKIDNVKVEHDFKEVEHFFSMSDFLEGYNPKRVYRERTTEAKGFEGTYKFSAIRKGEYEHFRKMLKNELDAIENAFFIKKRYEDTDVQLDQVINLLSNNEIINIMNSWVSREVVESMQSEEAYENHIALLKRLERYSSIERLNEEITKLRKALKEKIGKSNFEKAFDIYNDMSFNQWQSGKLPNGQKLGKAMRKAGFSSELLDFYSAQIKDEEEYFITISGAPQMVAGISNYAAENSWNGYQGTSCQDTRHNSGMEKNLLGNLYDSNLLSIMLHKELEDLDDMQDKLKARVTARVFYHDGIAILAPNRIYGNNVTSNALSYGLELLAGLKIGILREQYNSYDTVSIRDEQPQAYSCYSYSMYYADYSGTYWIDCECPVCNGNGEVTAMNDDNERYFNCPVCDGNGTIEHEIEVGWREGEVEEEFEEDELLGSYEDGTLYYNDYSVTMRVNESELLDQVEAILDRE